jgi:hypothetical protein
VQVPAEVPRPPRRGEWPAPLRELTAQLDAGRIYAHDLVDLSTARTDLLAVNARVSS